MLKKNLKENSTSLKEMRMLKSQKAEMKIIPSKKLMKNQKAGSSLKSQKIETLVKLPIQMMKSQKAESLHRSPKIEYVEFSNHLMRKIHETEVSRQADDITIALNVAGTGINTMA